jgi:hypothetical protein
MAEITGQPLTLTKTRRVVMDGDVWIFHTPGRYLTILEE